MLNCTHKDSYWCDCSKELSDNLMVVRDGSKVLRIVNLDKLDIEREKILTKGKISKKDMGRLQEINDSLESRPYKSIWKSDIEVMSLLHRAAKQIKEKLSNTGHLPTTKDRGLIR